MLQFIINLVNFMPLDTSQQSVLKTDAGALYEALSKNNILKAAYFPKIATIELDGISTVAHYATLWTFGRRTEKGVSEGDACSIDYGRLCKAILKAGEEKRYDAMQVEDYLDCFAQVVNPDQTREQRKNSKVWDKKVSDYNLICSGGFPNLDAMISQHPGAEFDYPYRVKDMQKARRTPGRANVVWNYSELVEARKIDLESGYTWQNMLAEKEPWQWSLLRVQPSGKIHEITSVDEVPSDKMIRDAVLIYAGLGINPYNPEKHELLIVGGRGGSSAIGGGAIDNSQNFQKMKGSKLFTKELRDIVEERPDDSKGIKFAAETWLKGGKPAKIGGIFPDSIVYM